MKKNRRLFARCLMGLTLIALLLPGALAEAAQKKKKKPHRAALSVTPIKQKNPKYAAIVIDAGTGVILSSDSPDALRHPASLTKMMTLLMVFDAMDAGRLRPGQSIRVSARAASMPASKLGLRAGSTIRVDDAIASLATLSANDMAVALAEAVSGSESAFARKMTARAGQIGMSRTRFYNASGLPNSYQVTTARDMARLARYLLAQHPGDSRIFAKQRFAYRGRTYNNHNRLMETYAGMDCCKTGYINASGFNLVASAKRDGKRLIGVVFGGRTTVSRNMEMASLLDSGFDKAKNLQVASVKTPLVRTNAQEPVSNAAPKAPPRNPPIDFTKPVIPTAAPAVPDVVLAAATAREAAPLEIRKLAPVSAIQSQNLGTLNLSATLPAAGTTNPYAQNPAQYQEASLPSADAGASDSGYSDWAIQIGAYQTRLATDQAIYKAQQKLPPGLRKGSATVVPLRTADASWMFRARLSGYTRTEAEQACGYFKDCLTISPQAY